MRGLLEGLERLEAAVLRQFSDPPYLLEVGFEVSALGSQNPFECRHKPIVGIELTQARVVEFGGEAVWKPRTKVVENRLLLAAHRFECRVHAIEGWPRSPVGLRKLREER